MVFKSFERKCFIKNKTHYHQKEKKTVKRNEEKKTTKKSHTHWKIK